MAINELKKAGADLPLRTQTTPAKAGVAEQASIASTGTSSDSVTLSAGAQALSASGGGGPVFDARKVEEIKAAIASGQFTVDPEKVAQGLMDTVRDLISTRRKD